MRFFILFLASILTTCQIALAASPADQSAGRRQEIPSSAAVHALKTSVLASTTWKQATGLYGGQVSSLVTLPGGKVFAGLGRGGVYYSTDNGSGWVQAGLQGDLVSALAVDSSGRLYAGILGGILSSTDDGVTWTMPDTAIANDWVECLLVDKSGNVFAGTQADGLYESTDHGASWAKTSLTSAYVWSLAVDSSGDVFAGVSGGVYESTDDGTSWSQLQQTSGMTTALAIAPDGVIYAGNYVNGVYVSTDSGSTWTQENSGIMFPVVHCLLADTSGRIYVGTDLGEYTSADSGKSWESSDSLLAQGAVHSLGISSAGYIITGAPTGISLSTDGGKSWVESDSGMSGISVGAIAVAPSGSIFAGTMYHGVVRSTDGGSSWSLVGPHYGLNSAVQATAVSPKGTVYAGTYGRGIYSSTDGGATWKTASLPGAQTDIVYSLAIDPSGDAFAGSDLGGVYESTDNGAGWSQMGVVGNDISCLAIDSSGLVYAGANGPVWLSTDGGTTWNLLVGIGTFVGLNALAADFSGNIYAGTDSGVYVSRNQGSSWTARGLSSEDIRSLYINSSGYIFAGTWSHGVLRSTDAGKTWLTFDGGMASKYVGAITSDASGHLFAGTNGGGVYYTTGSASPHPAPLLIQPRGTVPQPRLTTFNWSHTPVATMFHLQVASAPALDTTGAFVERNVVEDTLVADTTFKETVPLASIAKYYWHVAAVDTGGTSPYSATVTFTTGTGLDAVTRQPGVPKEFSLSQNYPNPFNPTTTINYQLPKNTRVTIKVYNVLGQKVATLVDGEMPAGYHHVVFEGARFASGIYLYRMTTSSFSSSEKMLLLK